MAGGDLRQMVVSLSLESSNFSKNIRLINAQIAEAQSAFAAASAGIDGFANTIKGAETKLGTLNTVYEGQQRAIINYQNWLASLNSALSSHAGTLAKLKTELADQQAAYKSSGDIIRSHSKELRSLDNAYKKAETAVAKDYEEIERLKNAMISCDRTTSDGKAQWDSYAAALQTATEKLKADEEALAATGSKRDALKAQLESEKTARTELQKSIAHTKGQIDAEEKTIEEDGRKIADTTDKLNKMNKAHEETYAEILKTKQSIEELNAGWQEQQGKIDASEAALVTYALKLGEIKSAYSAATAGANGFFTNTSTVQAGITQITNSIDTYKAKLAALETEIAAYKQQQQAALSSNNTDAFNEISNKLVQLQTEYNNTKATIAGLESDLTRQQVAFKSTGTAVDSSKAALKELETAWINADAEIKKGETSINSYKLKLQEIKSAYELASSGGTGFISSMTNVRARVKFLTESLAEHQSTLATLEAEYEQYKIQLEAATKAGDTAKIQEVKDKMTQLRIEMNNTKTGAKNIKAELEKMTGVFGTVSTYVNTLATSMKTMGNNALNLASQLSRATRYITDFGKTAIDESNNFESAMASVKQTVKETTSTSYSDIATFVKGLSTQVGLSATELATLAASSGQLGVATDDLENFITTVAQLAVTTNMTAEDAGTSIARFANITGMSLNSADGELTAFGSTLVTLANNTATTGSEIMDMASNISAAGSQVGMTDGQILALAATLSSLGLKSEKAGTSFSTALTKIELAVQTNSKSLKDYASVAGMTAEQFSAAWKQDATTTFMTFIQGIANMSDEGISAIKTIDDLGFTNVRLRDTLLRTTNGVDQLRSNLILADSAWNESTALAETAGERYQTTAIKIENLKNAWTNFAIMIGDDLKPKLNAVIDTLSGIIEWFSKLDSTTRETIENIGIALAGVTAVLTVFGTVSVAVSALVGLFGSLVGAVGSVVRVVATLGSGLVTLVTSLPTIVAGVGSFVSGLASAVTSSGALATIWTVATGPVGWIALATAAVVGLCVALKALDDSVSDETVTKNVQKNVTELQKDQTEYGSTHASATVTTDVDVDTQYTFSEQASNLYDSIFSWLTDGKKDTEEQKAEAKEKFKTYFDGILSQIDDAESESLAAAKNEYDSGLIGYDEYIQKCATIRANAKTARDEVSGLYDESINLVDQYAGQSTSTVKNAEKVFNDLESRVNGLLEKMGIAEEVYAQMNESMSISSTKGGTTGNLAIWTEAFTTEGLNWAQIKSEITGKTEETVQTFTAYAEAAYQKALLEDDGGKKAGLVTAWYNFVRGQLTGETETQESELQQTARDSMSEMVQGILTTMPDFSSMIKTADSGTGLYNILLEYVQNSISGENWFQKMGHNINYSDIIKKMDFSELTSMIPETILDNLMQDTEYTSWSDYVAGVGENTAKQFIIDYYEGMYSEFHGGEGTVNWNDYFNSDSFIGSNLAALIDQLKNDENFQELFKDYDLGDWDFWGTFLSGGFSQPTSANLQEVNNSVVTGWETIQNKLTALSSMLINGGITSWFAKGVDTSSLFESLWSGLFGGDGTGTGTETPTVDSITATVNKVVADTSGATIEYDVGTEETSKEVDFGDIDGKGRLSSVKLEGTEKMLEMMTADGESETGGKTLDLGSVDVSANIGTVTVNGTDKIATAIKGSGGGVGGVRHVLRRKSAYSVGDVDVTANIASATVSGADEIGKAAAKAAQGGANGFTFSFSTAAKNAYSKMKSGFEGKNWGSIGSNIVDGVMDGLNDKSSSAVHSAKELARSMLQAMKDELGIHSPSRIFRDEVGVMISRGVSVGVESESKKQAKVIKNAVRYMTSAASEGLLGNGFSANDNRQTYNTDSSVTINGNFTVRDENDIRSLASEIAALVKTDRGGRGVRTI